MPVVLCRQCRRAGPLDNQPFRRSENFCEHIRPLRARLNRAIVLMLMTHSETQTRQLLASRPLLDAARCSASAVAALNFYNAETLLAHVRAATALRASIILQTTESTIDYLGIRLVVAMARAAAEEIEAPV